MTSTARKLTVARRVSSNPVRLRLVVGGQQPKPKPRVLVVDDDHEVREALASLLTSWGLRVDRFDAGSRALEFLQAGPTPNLVLLDLLLNPDMNGWQFLELFRKERKLKDIPVIAMSGALRPSQLHQCKSQAFLEKPFDDQTLRSLLERYRLLRN